MTHSFGHTRRAIAGRIAAVAFIGGASLTGLACAREPAQQVGPAAMASVAPASAGALPVAVNCGPGQQALIRPSVINGQAISQVDCVATAASAAAYPVAAAGVGPMAVAYQPVSSGGDVDTVRVIERPVYRQAARPASYRTAEYAPERRVARSGRTWQKSALIIGSSAGIGAGVGGAVGGKKGALIGAALGGGGATIWDQISRR